MKKIVIAAIISVLSMHSMAQGINTNPILSAVKATTSPEDFVNKNVQVVFEQFKTVNSKPEYRKIVETQIFPHMDWEEINKRVLGKYVRQFTEPQRTEFNALFKKLILTSYVGIVDNYKNAQFSQGRTVVLEDGIVKVRMQLRQRETINIDYYLSTKPAGWKMFDVVVDGVSFLEVYRTGFTQDLAQGTPEMLLAQLHKKLDNK